MTRLLLRYVFANPRTNWLTASCCSWFLISATRVGWHREVANAEAGA
jgi:hypothetical protein